MDKEHVSLEKGIEKGISFQIWLLVGIHSSNFKSFMRQKVPDLGRWLVFQKVFFLSNETFPFDWGGEWRALNLYNRPPPNSTNSVRSWIAFVGVKEYFVLWANATEGIWRVAIHVIFGLLWDFLLRPRLTLCQAKQPRFRVPESEILKFENPPSHVNGSSFWKWATQDELKRFLDYFFVELGEFLSDL